MSYSLADIVRNFIIDVDVAAYGNGHINDTYIADSEPKYILQRINHAIFKKPDEVMSNILGVTEFCAAKLRQQAVTPTERPLPLSKPRTAKATIKPRTATISECTNISKIRLDMKW